jgi:hypothetical protein
MANPPKLPIFQSTDPSLMQMQVRWSTILNSALSNLTTSSAPLTYFSFSPTPSQTVVVPIAQAGVILTPVTTIAACTIKLPAIPTDGQTIWISTSHTVTSLTITDANGASVYGAPSTLTAVAPCQFVYSAAPNKWFRNG